MKLEENSFKTVSKLFWNCFSFITLCRQFYSNALLPSTE